MDDDRTRWVVGVDGSSGAEHALKWAIAQAPSHADRITLVRVWAPIVPAGPEFGVTLPITVEPATAYEGLEVLRAQMATEGVEVDAEVRCGGTSSELLEAGHQASMLVVGSRGLGGFARLLLGSVSHQCATHADVPVVVIPGSADVDRRASRIVVGVDGADGGRAALRWALDFAHPDTEVHAVGAWSPTPWAAETDLAFFDELMHQAQAAFESSVVEAERGDAGRVVRHFEVGPAASTLLDLADEHDLLVVGERSHGGLGSVLLGSVTTRVVHQARGAVAIVPVTASG